MSNGIRGVLASSYTRVTRQAPVAAPRVLVLEPGRAERHYWRDLWRYRELFAILAWRDVAVRYKQTVIGVAWAVIRPLLTMVVFTVVFGQSRSCRPKATRRIRSWSSPACCRGSCSRRILSDASNSLVGNANLIGKVYFPRIIIPPSSAVVALVDFAINFADPGRADGLVRFVPNWQVVLLPVFVVLAVLASLGPGAVLTA